MNVRYEVQVHGFGRPLCKSGPMSGCYGYPTHTWTRITLRPIGLTRAKHLADAQPHRAVVAPWMETKIVYDNGKAPYTPDGWRFEEYDPSRHQ